MRLLVAPPAEVDIEGALARSGGLLWLAKREHTIAVTASWVTGQPAIVLGSLQRAGRVLDRIERVIRRTTTGTGFALHGGLVISLALPYLDAAFGDATPRTLLNRNLRPLMKGLERAGISTQYFGREWIAWKRRAMFVIGFDVDPDGAVLIEAFATNEASLAIEPSRASALEVSCDRYRSRPSANLVEAGLTSASVQPMLAGIAERLGLVTSRIDSGELEVEDARRPRWVTDPFSPLPNRDVELLAPVPVPIGFLDVARLGERVWIGGDMLAPRSSMGLHIKTDPDVSSIPLEGVLWEDVLRAHDLASQVSRCQG